MNLISVLIPFYNREDYLLEALQSITNQTNKDWQAILYDDGSTDRSTEIAEDWLTQNPGFLIRSEMNRGVGHARDYLLGLVDTPYACWMDSDDFSMPERLDKQIGMIKNFDIVFSSLRFCKDGRCGAKYTIDVSKYTSREGLYNNTTFATGFFRSDLATYPFMDLQRKEDVLWLVSLIEDGIKFGYIDEDLYHVRQHDKRLTIKE